MFGFVRSVVAWLVVLFAMLASQAEMSASARTSVVVAELASTSIAEGVKVDDILLAWSRAASPPANPQGESGVTLSPFDVLEIETEQAPRGQLTLTIRRHGRPLEVAMPSGHWDLITRPDLRGAMLGAFENAEGSIKKQERVKARTILLSLAEKSSRNGDSVLAAWLFTSAAESDAKGGLTADTLAIFRRAAESARAAADWKAESQVWLRLGQSQMEARAFAPALESFSTALETRTKHEDETLFVALVRQQMASAEFQMGRAAEATELFNRVLKARERLAPGSIPVATSLNNLAVAALQQGRYLESDGYLTRALAIEEAQGRGGAAYLTMLSNEAAVSQQLGNLPKAERFGKRAVALEERKDPQSLGTAYAVGNLANVYAERGDLAQAEASYSRALEILREKDPESPDQGVMLMNLGLVAKIRGEGDSAETYMRAALEIGTRAQAWENVALALVNLSNVALELGDFAEAEDFASQSVRVWEEHAPGGVPHALAIGSVAQSVAKRGRLSEAQDLLLRSMAMLEAAAPGSLHVASMDQSLGDLALERGDVNAAERYLEAARSIRHRLSPDAVEIAEIQHSLARLEKGRRNGQKARALGLEAIAILERQSGRLGGGQDAVPGFLAKHRAFYTDLVDLLVEAGLPGEAFAVQERSRSRALLELLGERDLQPLDVPVGLDQHRRQLDAEYEQLQSEIQSANPTTDAERVDKLLETMNELRRERQETADQIRISNPEYAALQYPQPLDLTQARSALDAGTLLLSYSIGPEKALLFAVEPLESKGAGLTVYPLAGDEKSLREAIEAYRDSVVSAPVDASTRGILVRSRALYDLLVKPAEPLISRYSRLLILPDGPLHSLPFASLVKDMKVGQPQCLVEWKPIHTAVSATVYAELRRARRPTVQNPSVILAAFGDPQYPDFVDKKPGAKRSDTEEVDSESITSDPQLRSVERGGFRFQPLPASRLEVEQIARLYAPRSAAYIGPDATEEKAKAVGKDVPLIHFACHAVINERFPLDSALVFTIPDKLKAGQDNGLLQAWEIIERFRIDADLVTLSACNSGLGKEVGGEGLIGLTRAFQYAGARTVLASLWKVEDASTAELMKRFYTYLKAGKTKDEALRLAQIDLIHSTDYSQPRDWAAFQLNGDWK